MQLHLPSLARQTNYAETERLVGRPTDQAGKRERTEGRTAKETNDRLQMELPLLSLPLLPFLSSPFFSLSSYSYRQGRRRGERGTKLRECEQSRHGMTRQTANTPFIICTCVLSLTEWTKIVVPTMLSQRRKSSVSLVTCKCKHWYVGTETKAAESR